MASKGTFQKKFLAIRREQREAQYKSGYERLSKQRAYEKTRTVIIPRGYDEYGNPISSRTVNKRTVAGRSAGRPGRPSGTYDRRYAAYGGVYGYRKMLAAKLRGERIQMMREAAVNPRQREILNQVEARQQAERMNPERKTFPDTGGRIDMSSFMREVDDAAGIVP